jgi:hypothetical protein
MREYIEVEKERIRTERDAAYKRYAKERRQAQEQRLLSGVDCPWTKVGSAVDFYCRRNGRTYRLSPTSDKMWQAFRVTKMDGARGQLSGKY